MNIMTFNAENSALGIFFNDKIARSNNYSLKNSKVKGIKLAVSKKKVVGIMFNAKKITGYKVISDFLVKQLKIDCESTEAIMTQIVGLSIYHNDLSDTVH